MRNAKIYVIIFAAVLLSHTSFASALSFSDVKPSSNYYDAVADLVDSGIIAGFPDGSFRPDNPVTRAQLAVMLVNANRIRTSSADSYFPDVSESHWAYEFIAAAVSAGFITGYPDGTFKPDRNVSCDEALTMIVASLGYTMDDLTGSYPTCFTNKAREIGLLNTCKKVGRNSASRADVACYLSDSFRYDAWVPTEAEKAHMREAVVLWDRTTHGFFNFEFDGTQSIELDPEKGISGVKIKGHSIKELEDSYIKYARQYLSEEYVQTYTPYISECVVCINGTCYSTWLGEWLIPLESSCTFYPDGEYYVMRHEFGDGPVSTAGVFYEALYDWQGDHFVMVDYRPAE